MDHDESPLLDNVRITGLLHRAGEDNVTTYSGKYGNKSITARHYLTNPYIRDDSLVPSVLRNHDVTNVLAYIGVTILNGLVYYIFENYSCLLENFRQPLLTDGWINPIGIQLLVCISTAFQELRHKGSSHLGLGWTDIAIISQNNKLRTGFLQAKIILKQSPLRNDPRKQVEIDCSSIVEILSFFVYGSGYQYPEAADFIRRMDKTNRFHVENNDLLIAFAEDARRITDHPFFWTEEKRSLFIFRLAELLLKIKDANTQDVNIFLGGIRNISVLNWNLNLPPSMNNFIADKDFNDAVDFLICVRNIDIHFPRNSVNTQRVLNEYWPSFLSTNPGFVMESYKVAESFFGFASIKTGYDLSKYVLPNYFDDFLIHPLS